MYETTEIRPLKKKRISRSAKLIFLTEKKTIRIDKVIFDEDNRP